MSTLQYGKITHYSYILTAYIFIGQISNIMLQNFTKSSKNVTLLIKIV